MEIFNMRFFIFFMIFIPEVFSCPFNCECTQFKSVCTVIFEGDELDMGCYLLVVKGKLYPRHYLELNSKPDLRKELHDSSCRSLENCE